MNIHAQKVKLIAFLNQSVTNSIECVYNELDNVSNWLNEFSSHP